MPWQAVTDPNEIVAAQAQLSKGGGGGGKLGSAEAKTQEAQLSSNGSLVPFMDNLVRSEEMNRRIPTGRWNAKVSDVGQSFPSGWQTGDVSNYQTMMALRQAMLKPAISLNSGGVSTSSKEFDTPRELEMAMSAIPGPDKERGANAAIGSRLYGQAMEQYSRNVASQRWRAKFGSLSAPSKTGRLFEDVFSSFLASPQGPGRRTLQGVVDEGERRAKARLSPSARAVNGRRVAAGRPAAPGVVDFHDLPE